MNNTALTLDQVRAKAPSAFAMEADASRSARYTYLPTVEVIKGMESAGFMPFAASQSRSRDAARAEHTKHMIRFRNSELAEVDGLFPEVVLINSHDGSSSYRLMAGIFRLVCSNGLIIADSMFGEIRVKHTGDIVQQVIDASFAVIESAPRTLDTVKEWKSLQLTAGESNAFAEAAHHVRFADAEGKVETPITAAQLLQPRRRDDSSPDMWSTLNRVQENVMRGGLSARGPRDERGHRGRRVSTRAINGIDQDVKLNRALWSLAEKMAELKRAA